MKLRILIYGVLIIIVCLLTTLYLVYTNQDRILQSASYKLTSLAREKWGLNLGMKRSRLNLYRNTVVFRNLTLSTQNEDFRFSIGKMEMSYSLRKLLQGEVYFSKIFVERPVLEVRLPPERRQGRWELGGLPSLGQFVALVGFAERIDLEQGMVRLADPAGQELLRAEGLGMQLKTGGEGVQTKVWAQRMKINHPWYREQFTQVFLQGKVESGGLDFRRFDLATESAALKARGKMSADGSVEADFEVQGDLEKFRPSVPGLLPLSGQVEGGGRFSLRGSDWSLDGRAKIRKLSVGEEPIPDGTTAVELRPDRCAFTQIDCPLGNGGRLRGRCDLDWSGKAFAWSFEARATDARAASIGYLKKHFPGKWLEPLGPLGGTVAFRSPEEGGNGASWVLGLNLTGRVEKYLGSNPAQLRGTVHSAGMGVLSLTDFALTSGPLRASWAGTYSESAGPSVAFIAETEDLASSVSPFGIAWVGGRASLAGDITGMAEAFTLSGGLTAEPLNIKGVTLDRVQGQVRYGQGKVAAEKLTLKRGSGQAVLTGTYILRPDTAVTVSAELKEVEATDLKALLGADVQVGGRLSGAVTISGAPGRLFGSGRLASPLLVVTGREFRDMKADFTLAPDAVDFRRIEAGFKGGSVLFEGRWGMDGQVSGRLSGKAPDLPSLIPVRDLAGTADYQVSLSGPWRDPEILGTVTLRQLRIIGVAWPDLNLKVEKKERHLSASGPLMNRFPLSLRMEMVSPYLVTGDLIFDDLDLQTILPYLRANKMENLAASLERYSAVLSGTAEFAVPVAVPGNFSGTCSLRKIELKLGDEMSRLRGPAVVTFSRSGIKAGKMVFEGDLHRFTLEGGLEGGRLSMTLKGTLDLSFLAGRFPKIAAARLRPEIAVSLAGTIDSPQLSGMARIRGGEVEITGLSRPVEEIEASAEFERDVVKVREFSLRYAGRTVKGDGWYNIREKRMRLQANGVLPLSALERPIPGVKEYSGEAAFDVDLWGTPAAPSYQADITIREGMVRLTEAASPLRKVSAVLSVSDEYVRVREAAAEVSGGRVRAAGYLVWPWGELPDDVNLDLAAEKLLLTSPGTVKVVASADLNLRGSLEGMRLGGQVVVERGKYFRDMTPRPIVLSPGGEPEEFMRKKVREYSFLARLSLDLHLLAEEGFWIDNNVAKIDTSIDLRVKGTAAEPLFTGQVRVLKGTIFYLGKKFDLDEAAALFPEKVPLDPYLTISARTVVSSVTIRLAVSGNLSSLTLDLSSDPPYSREDIISLLTLGAPRSLLENRGRDVSAVGALMVFSGALLTKFEDRARSFTGLEVFQIEPTMSDTGGAARVVVGKQVADRMFLSYSRNLAASSDEQFSMEYQLLDYLSLVGKQDRRGVFSFDVVFSFGGLRWLGK